LKKQSKFAAMFAITVSSPSSLKFGSNLFYPSVGLIPAFLRATLKIQR